MAEPKVLRLDNNGRRFYQWDTGRKMVVHDARCTEVHFSNLYTEQALVCGIYDLEGLSVVDVPNILLQAAEPILVHLSLVDESGRRTTYTEEFQVRARKKPADYVYTETEVLNYAALDNRLQALEGEGLSNAVAAYLEENPVEAGATAEEAAQIRQNKADVEKLTADKLDAAELPAAVSDALAQAKASGEFDGYTPQKNVDYFDGKDYTLTEADKQEIAELTAELVDVPQGGGGGGMQLELIHDIVVEESVNKMNLDMRKNGKPVYWRYLAFVFVGVFDSPTGKTGSADLQIAKGYNGAEWNQWNAKVVGVFNSAASTVPTAFAFHREKTAESFTFLDGFRSNGKNTPVTSVQNGVAMTDYEYIQLYFPANSTDYNIGAGTKIKIWGIEG